MNTKDLKYFHQLASQKKFSKVADIFHVSQPTVTMAIKRLENHYGVPLIIRDRSHQAVELTSFGHQFDRHVASILNEFKLVDKEAQQDRKSVV